MTSSGTYAFQPSAGDLTLQAFSRILLRGPALQQEHWQDAARESNLLQVEFSNRQPNLWRQELYTVALTQGTASYTLPARMISPMAVYMTTESGDNDFDRILGPLSTFEYAAMPQKTTQAPPTSYWFQKLTAPVIYLWPVPDQTSVYTLKLQILSQIQDASLPAGVTVDLPYLWLDAWVAGLASRLAKLYPSLLVKERGPGAVAELAADAERAWQFAATQGVEEVPLFIQPALGYLYR